MLHIQPSAGPTVSRVVSRPVCRVAWEAALGGAYVAELQTPSVQQLLRDSSAAALIGDLDLSDCILVSALRSSALVAGARRSCPGVSLARSKRPNHSAPFFDNDCRIAYNVTGGQGVPVLQWEDFGRRNGGSNVSLGGSNGCGSCNSCGNT